MWLHYVPVVIVVLWSSSALAFPQNDQQVDSNATPESDPVTFGADGFIFDGPADTDSWTQTTSTTSTSTTASSVSTENPQLEQCISTCSVTPEYNPVCGTDGVNYENPGGVSCAQMCGKDVVIQYYGRCTSLRMRGR